MKFQEIDFHIELFKAYLEPPGTEIYYLEKVRKQSKIKREVFLIKLDEAFNNIQKAFNTEFNFKKSWGLNSEAVKDMAIPIMHFSAYDALVNFVRYFHYDNIISKETLEGLSLLKNSYRISILIKEKKKAFDKVRSEKVTNENSHCEGYSSPLQIVIDEIQGKGTSEENLSIESINFGDSTSNSIQEPFRVSHNIIEKLIEGISPFVDGESELLRKLFNGESIGKKLFFKSNGNILTDVFYRLHENHQGMILNKKRITANWICDNFEFLSQKSKEKESFKYGVVYKQLTKKSGGLSKNKRICKDL